MVRTWGRILVGAALLVSICWFLFSGFSVRWIMSGYVAEITKNHTDFYRTKKTGFAVNFNLADFYMLNLVAENQKVDELSHLLTSNAEVINEAQRIHFNMFKALFGRYRYAMIFGLANFETKGDPAITVGEILLLRRLEIKIIFHCFFGSCSLAEITKAQELSRKYNNKDLIILLHGGGNILSYVQADILREQVLSRFLNFEVLVFPQSIWPRSPQSHQQRFQKIYSSHPRITFLYRDRDSYKVGKTMFPNARALLAPDMAFQIGAVTRTMPPTRSILWLRRGDDESLHYSIPNAVKGYDVCIEDWLDWKTPGNSTDIEKAFLVAANGFLFLQRGEVIITDRLHGHILSTLAGIPHVVLDPVNHKITSYMKSWTGGLDNVIVANSSTDAFSKALELSKQFAIRKK